MKQKWSSGFVVGLLFTALVIGGCAKGDDGSISTSVDSPSAATFRPVGTIQGKILDSTTREPIVNAVVSIGLAVDVSDAQGQYILANVPATSDALNGTVTGSYDITVDLRAVVSPVDMRVAATAPRYPDFRYQNASVSFTSLNDTDCDNINNSDSDGLDTCENSSNHDTAVDGLVSSQDVLVGKLAANIQGVVAGCSISDGDFFTPVANATVSLVSPSTLVSGSNSSTGSGRVVATATTDASGSFTFSNIEANQSFTIQAVDNATAPTAEDSVSITSPADNQTLFLRVQESTALHLCSVDTHGPEIIAVSPEPGSDLTPATTQTVVFTFSEPVAQTDETSTDPSNQVGLISSGALQVEFDGNKAPALFTAVWNATFDQLTVTMTNGTGTSALYEVIFNLIGLEDAAGNSAGNGVCPNDAPGPWVGIGGGAGDCVVYFSTNGGPTPGTTTALSLVNASSLDYASTVGIFDWPVISGAKEYNLYCQRSQVYTDGTSQVDSN
ncbi:MAG: hypothetical protein HY349_07500, partial [Nitrospirae bacterium]|nr:hypothetical protein [Nitrospirota bacterium]